MNEESHGHAAGKRSEHRYGKRPYACRIYAWRDERKTLLRFVYQTEAAIQVCLPSHCARGMRVWKRPYEFRRLGGTGIDRDLVPEQWEKKPLDPMRREGSGSRIERIKSL